MKRFIVGLAAGVVSTFVSSILAADARIDVSQIIDKATAESILGEKVTTATPRNADAEDGYYSKCNYYGTTAGKILIVRLHQIMASSGDAQKELATLEVSTGPMKPVANLGDKAELSSGRQSALPANVVMLYVAKGNSLITVGLGGLKDESTAFEKSKKVAEKILAQL